MGIFSKKQTVTQSFRDKLTSILSPAEAKALEESAEVLDQEIDTVVEPSAVEEDDLENLSEEQLVEVLEEELTSYITYLLDEGFSDQEVEDLIIAALADEADEEAVDDEEETAE